MTTRLIAKSSAKVDKTAVKTNYVTGVLYLAPAKLSGFEVCPLRSAGCTSSCLNTAGRGRMTSVQRSRVAKTRRYFEDREGFLDALADDIRAIERKAKRLGKLPSIRLNGTSDIPWHKVPYRGAKSIIDFFFWIRFYDYTKRDPIKSTADHLPRNYDLTFSLHESNREHALRVLRGGFRVAAVFSPECYREVLERGEWQGFPVVDGDEHDVTFLRPAPSWLALRAKGDAIKDRSGFVIRDL